MTQEKYKSLGKRKVLVADDVEMNQYLAQQIMESWGFEVHIASNGRMAVELAEQNRYDLVLMDIQMPEMDGIEATLQIRGMNNEEKAGIPIIAVTANTTPSDRQKYQAAGMNDLLSKPINEPSLFRVIEHHLTHKDSMFPGEVPVEELTVPYYPERLYDLSVVRGMSNGDDTIVMAMIRLFIETVPESLEIMQQEIQTLNRKEVAKEAHKIKSAVDAMGLHMLHDDVRVVEKNIEKNVPEEKLTELVKHIVTLLEQCMAQLKRDFTFLQES